MAENGVVRAVGLMSGTSLDGIDAAVLETDGREVAIAGPWLTIAYAKGLRDRLRGVLGSRGPVAEVERELTETHAAAVRRLLDENGLAADDVAVVGFHGHTIDHRPRDRVTRQIGDGALLARRTGIDVVADFRSADVAAGGEGAPFAPLYHQALCAGIDKPVCVLNIGGIANLTWIGPDGTVLAFDTGPGNALIDDWTLKHAGRPYDEGGKLAAAGTADAKVTAAYLHNPYFGRPPPKSLDRLDFDLSLADGLAPADGAATLTAVTCAGVARAIAYLPERPRSWLVTGGGRHNPMLMQSLAGILGVPVVPVEDADWNGDAIEAQAFAYLAVRALEGLPLSLPTTTGVPRPTTGGRVFRATG